MTPADAADILSHTLARVSEPDQAPDTAMTVLRQIADGTGITGFLRAIRDDRAAAHCARLSYRHPLGFETIMLVDEEPEFSLRLHVWWPDAQPGVEHVHNHRFLVATVVLLGNYDMRIYQSASSGIQMDEYQERSAPDQETWRLEHVGAARLRLLTSTRIGTGSGYALPADALHRVKVPLGTLCVTLFLTAPVAPSRPTVTQVFAPPGSPAPAQSWKQAFSLTDYQKRLDTIAAELGTA